MHNLTVHSPFHHSNVLQVLAASVVEDEVAKKTGLTPLNIEATQRLRTATRSPEAQGKSERIMDIIASITRVSDRYYKGRGALYRSISKRSIFFVLAGTESIFVAVFRALYFFDINKKQKNKLILQFSLFYFSSIG